MSIQEHRLRRTMAPLKREEITVSRRVVVVHEKGISTGVVVKPPCCWMMSNFTPSYKVDVGIDSGTVSVRAEDVYCLYDVMRMLLGVYNEWSSPSSQRPYEPSGGCDCGGSEPPGGFVEVGYKAL